MKKFLLFLFLNLIILLSTPSCNAETVVYNVKTGKIHAVWCQWANKCTVNCIKIERKDAINRGGVPCKVCNGGR